MRARGLKRKLPQLQGHIRIKGRCGSAAEVLSKAWPLAFPAAQTGHPGRSSETGKWGWREDGGKAPKQKRDKTQRQPPQGRPRPLSALAFTSLPPGCLTKHLHQRL